MERLSNSSVPAGSASLDPEEMLSGVLDEASRREDDTEESGSGRPKMDVRVYTCPDGEGGICRMVVGKQGDNQMLYNGDSTFVINTRDDSFGTLVAADGTVSLQENPKIHDPTLQTLFQDGATHRMHMTFYDRYHEALWDAFELGITDDEQAPSLSSIPDVEIQRELLQTLASSRPLPEPSAFGAPTFEEYFTDEKAAEMKRTYPSSSRLACVQRSEPASLRNQCLDQVQQSALDGWGRIQEATNAVLAVLETSQRARDRDDVERRSR